jgi:TP901 family phage tail tape measure protein
MDKKIRISLDINTELGNIQSKMSQLQQQLNKVQLNGLSGRALVSDFDNIQNRIGKLQELADRPLTVKSDFSKAEKETLSIQTAIKKLTKEVEQLQTASNKKKLELLPNEQKQKIEKANSALSTYEKSINKTIGKTNELKKAEKDLTSIQEELSREQKKSLTSQSAIEAKTTNLENIKKQLREANKLKQATAEAYKQKGWSTEVTGRKYQSSTKVDVDGQKVALKDITEKVIRLREEETKLTNDLNNLTTSEKINEINQRLKVQNETVDTLTTQWKELNLAEKSRAFNTLKEAAQQLGISLEGIGGVDDVETLINRFQQLEKNGIDAVDTALRQLKTEIKSTTPSLDQISDKISQAGDDFDLASQRVQEFASLKSQVLSFFTITGAIQLFQRAVQSAFETVKELDEAMTEIAVVSDFSVGDMWKQLPKFTEQANQLGKSISDVYGATTLYVQQGLDLNNSLKLANETLKMAAVAGMDSKDATDAMTSALRGFNMELNETSAQKINDVYSELAAISAADTQEISTAMSKVASLAHNVNMEFETTASFLTQGIEATREAPETIGTALKTVIARFAEVKSLVTKGQLTGADEEGEVINVNKVQTALRSAGISMTAFLKGEEGLDQVLLKLSSRWNDLDVLTQRYIATMAAGSRQQSRFIAMMDNYAKTTEFVNSAYNSAGSGQRQFEKTLESLAAKLTKLKNAWDEFAMGLTNNVIIKGAVDTLTVLLTAVNKLIDGLSGGQGLIKSVMTLGAVWGGIKLGGNLVDKALASNWVQNKIKLTKGDSETVANIRGTNTERTSYYQKGANMANEFQRGFQSFKASDRKGGFFLENVLGIDTKNNQIKKELAKNVEDIKQDIAGSQEDYTMGYIAVPEDLDDQLTELDRKYKKNAISAEEYENSLVSLGASQESAKARLGSFDKQQKKVQVNTQKLGTATTVVGGAFMALAGIFSMFGEKGQKVASVLATIGGVLVVIGQAIPAISKAYLALKATHPELLAISAALAVIAGLVSVTLISMKRNSPEAQLEKASKATEKAKEMAEGAAQAYDELLNKKSEFDKLTTSLETLTQGTLEWRKALAEANNEVISLQKEFPELKVSVDKATGQLKIDNWADVLEAQAERVEATNKQLTMAQINENNKRLNVTRADISSDKELTPDEKASKKEAEKMKTESTNVALISSLISKYQTKANEDILQNLAETIFKDLTYEVEVKDTRGNGNNKSKVNTTHKEARTSNVYESKVNAEANKAVNSLSASQRKMKAEEVFGKDAVANMKDKEIKSALIDYEKGVAIENIAKKVANLTPNQQELLNRIQGTYTGTKSGWNTAKEKIFSDEDAKIIQDILGLDNIQAVFDMAKSGTEAISANIAQIESQFTKFGNEYSVSFLDQFSADNLSNIASQVDEMSIANAKAYLDAYSEALDGVKGEDRKRLDNYLSSIDLSDAVQVLDAKEFMKNLGMDETQIEKFWATANAAVEPYITSLEQVQSLNERISKLGEVRSLVENGEKTFSSSDKESLISAGFTDTDFLQTGIDEWTYVGKDNNDLLRQINEKVAQIGEHIVGNLQDSVEKGKKYGTIIENNDKLGKSLATLAESGYEGTSFKSAELKEMAETLGIAVENLSDEGIAKKLIDAYNMYKNLGENEEAVRRELVNNASRQYDLTGDFGTYTGNLTPKEQQDIVEAQLVKNTGAMELYNKLKAEANDTSKELNVELADEAIQLVKLTDHYKVAAKKVGDYRDVLIQGESAGIDFFAALDNAKSDLSTLFNVDKKLITDDFIQQYTQDIYNLAEGGEVGTQAFQNLWEAMKQIKFDSMVEGLDFFIKDGEDVINDFNTWIDGIDPTIGIGTELSTEGLESGLVLLAQQAYNAGKDVQTALAPAIEMLEELTGTKINVQYEEEEFDSGGRYISAKSMEGLLAQGWHVGKGGKLVRTKAITAVSASKAGSPYNKFVAPSVSSSGKGSTGGSSSEKKESTWENPYDKLYNLTEEINEALRRREKLEKEYDRILERRGSTFRELRKNYNAQLQSLQKEIALQNQLRAGRLAQLNALSSETYKGQDSEGNELIKSFADWGVTKYGSYNPNTGLLKIDWDAIDSVKDENLGSAIEAYISRLEELQGQIEDIDTQIEDFKDKVTELQKEGMQDYLDFEQKVYDAIVNQQQQLIDNYQDLSDKINDSNSKILDSIQRSIDLQRQIRDNTKTEEDINEKEARLAYLRQDTSNGNLLEIKQLEEELADDRQNYEDNLIDQQLERLTQQNDDAQTARERQIDLMQKQLDYASKNGDFWNQTYDLLTSAFTESGEINLASQVWELLKKDEGWKGMSKFGQLNWQEEISKAILAASHGYANWNMYKAKEIDKNLVTSNGISLHYNGSNWVDSKGNIYNGVDYDSKIGGFTYSGMTKAPTPSGGGSSSSSGGSGAFSIGSRVKADPNAIIYADSYGGGGGSQYYRNDPIYTILDENNGYYLTRYHGVSGGYTGWFRKKDLTPYKTGGIADFTGPAWLDGTKSNPELILNARDTENFIALKDILSSIMDRKGLQNNTQSVGDMYFNIDINVDEISNDYDVENLSKKIKQELTDSAMYRNVNLVNFIR